MSQHLATAQLNGRTVEVVAGFDRRLGDYFLQVHGKRNTVLYTSLQEPQRDWNAIGTLRGKVAELGLQLPSLMLCEVESDGLQLAGNRVVRYAADGPPVTLMVG